jgi:lipopolysaccharide transport system ATP-binding protein
MSDIVISVQKLSKRYLIGHRSGERERYTALRDVIVREARTFTRKAVDAFRGRQIVQGDEVEEFWALKDVSFDVERGEVIGVIGSNGAGKSTLLKIMSRITEPTSGRIHVRGRVASLLEVGTGFHPELTGRENIFLNGAILGMTRSEIRSKLDEIVAFAEIEQFLDTPVKHYSSGMYVRLAFAVAAHLEPEIMIIDEVLAVGDIKFQEKCLGKMREVARHGRTVLFVSHNMSAILQLTRRAVVLSKGIVTFIGASAQAAEKYMGSERAQITAYDVRTERRAQPGTYDVKILSLRFDRPSPQFDFLEPISYIIRVRAERTVDTIRAAMMIFAKNGFPVGSAHSLEIPGLVQGEERELAVTLPSPRLAPGSYFCGVSVGIGTHRTKFVNYDVVLDTLYFDVQPEVTKSGIIAGPAPEWGPISFPDMSIELLESKCLVAVDLEPVPASSE